MIGTTLQQVSRARSNTARILALFLTLSLMAHGLFFSQEWVMFAFALSMYALLSTLSKSNHVTEMASAFGLTDVLFLGMLFFSVVGIVHPVKVKDGFIETLRWGILWFVYRLGVGISADEIAKKHLVQYIEWLAIVVAIIGWLPWVSKVAGRLSSVFGYPNATAAFLGAVLLFCPCRKPVQTIFLGISLLGTGSRAGVGIFLAVLIGQFLLKVRNRQTVDKVKVQGFSRILNSVTRKIKSMEMRGLWVILLGVVGTALMLRTNRLAWGNLTSWSFSSASWQERLVYFKDGLRLAWDSGGIPRAGGWMAFPTVQRFPYWTADPHSSFIHILLNQGFIGALSMVMWSAFTLGQVWQTWAKESVPSISSQGVDGYRAEIRAGGALLFLGLHSLVDADFSFGTLGVVFWLIFGSIQNREKSPHSLVPKWKKLVPKLRGRGLFFISLILCLVTGSGLLNPILLEKEKTWNTQARLGREQDPARSIALWNMSLNWDQTQTSTRREQAESLLKSGNTDTGVQAVEEVLRWQPFNLEAYEWAQSVVWNAAEVQRRTHPEKAVPLYLWVEGIPQKIEGRAAILSGEDRFLWKGYEDFQPSQHIKLLVEYARQRQLTQLLPGT
ncbi:O-antigen ligase family protein [Desulfosporosinus sp. BG]|uniref:O-antigen ligase family protein n=1 Tax=Desulfosporosinus sp. BG TaxID=1633135 RepID=UPI00083AEBC0|nr:O-antigen ligase family protein [Desulfosporosinus sp. BG]ODA42610.1 TPR-repeat-containing protein [Desulfosporosinus sp. BG]